MLRGLTVLALFGLAACGGEVTYEYSTSSDPTTEFNIPVPDVDTGWPIDTDASDDDTGDDTGS